MTRHFDSAGFSAGLDLFNRADFFDAHEALEDVWRALPGDRHSRRHMQGLVQLAVAFHHVSTGNLVGACSVLKRGTRNLDGAESAFPEIDLDRLRADLEIWQRYLESVQGAPRALEGKRNAARQTAPVLPKITLRHATSSSGG